MRKSDEFIEMKNREYKSNGERGGASVKFLVILTVLFLIGNAAYNYIPIAYEGQDFRQEMETAVVQGMALPGNVDVVGTIKAKLKRAAAADELPPDAFIEVKLVNGISQARVAYTKQVKLLPFGIYNYTYRFDHTAIPTGFITKQL